MTRWAWVIDQTRCIGCHACTTACKSENDVAVGVFRTWVKNVEVGTFPAVRRHFAVLRCNHCENPPCVAICPVTAMYQRPDGLVDFNHDTCIGCKACMQACPYDAIYMDPDRHTAAKCNFCSHRVDEGLLPACVVVCPEEALLFGDLEDPASKVSRALGRHPVTVRRPEQGTRPMAFYIGAHDAALEPLAARHEATYMWADGRDGGRADGRTGGQNGPAYRPTDRQSASPPAVVAYDVPRQRTWGWKVSTYIWTKSIAAGAGLVAAWDWIRGSAVSDVVAPWVLPAVGMVFLALTGVLLVVDLKRPERFWTILFRPQWRSWLARGAFVITGYGALLALWLAATLGGLPGVLDLLAWPLSVLALLTGVYTAFLFAQCEGRDLWQSPLLLVHLALEAAVTGLAVVFVAASGSLRQPAFASLAGAAAALLALMAAVTLADGFGRHATTNATAAAHALTRGAQATLYWSALLGGVLAPLLLLLAVGGPALPLAGTLVLAGRWLHAHALVLAGQGPPIS